MVQNKNELFCHLNICLLRDYIGVVLTAIANVYVAKTCKT